MTDKLQVVIDSAADWSLAPKAGSPSSNPSPPQLLVFSANHQESLKKIQQNYERYIEEKKRDLNALAYTLAARRTHMQYRSFAIAGLDEPITFAAPIRLGNPRALVYVFTGQGAQWAGMGKELIADCPSFRNDIRAMGKTLANCPHSPSWSIEGKNLRLCVSQEINSYR